MEDNFMTQPITFQNIITSLPEPVKKIYREFAAKWTICETALTQWSNTHLSEEAAQKVQAVFKGLMHAAIIALTPPSVLIPVLAGYHIVNIVMGPFDNQTLESIWNGFATGAFCSAMFQGINFLTTFNPLYLLGALVYGFAAKFFATQGTLLN
jgi:hypothetical protein